MTKFTLILPKTKKSMVNCRSFDNFKCYQKVSLLLGLIINRAMRDKKYFGMKKLTFTRSPKEFILFQEGLRIQIP